MSKRRSEDKQKICEWGRETLLGESQALASAARSLDQDFVKAVQTLLSCTGKVVVTGLGKSGHVGRKIAATMASTGTSSVFLHPSEALHGDLGVISDEDVLLAIANSGETREVIEVAKFARRRSRPIIVLSGKKDSSLAILADAVVTTAVDREVCPLNLAPTASTTVTLAIGDALALATMRARGFRAEDFAQLHPEGALGRQLARVEEFMRPADSLSWASPTDTFHQLLEKVTHPNYGVVGVMDPMPKGKEAGTLSGVVTDGDLRRTLLANGAEALAFRAKDFMGSGPKTITHDALIADALKKFESHKITSIFVVDGTEHPTKVVGLLRLHDLMESKVI